MTVAVTGAGGFIGSWVCRELIARGLQVKGGSQHPPDEPVSGVDYVVGDLVRDPDLAATLLVDADVVIHLAARSGGIALQNDRPIEIFQSNRALTDAVFSALVRSDRARLFLASSAVVYNSSLWPLKESDPISGMQDSPSAYAWSKICDELVASWLGGDVSVVIGRFTNVYGPGGSGRGTVIHDLVERALAATDNTLEVWGDGSAVRSFLSVRDAARFVCDLALGTHEGVFNLDSGEAVTIGDLARMVAAGVSPDMTVRFDADRPSGARHRVLDTTKGRSVGLIPEVDIATGVADLIAFDRFRAVEK